MLSVLNRLLSWIVVVAAMVSGTAYAQFVSLHQFPIKYNISSTLDAQGNLTYTKTSDLVGFKDQFAPTGVSGCVIGYPEFRAQCLSVIGGLSFVFEGQQTDFREFRVFIPKGMTFFALRSFLPQSAQYAVAVRLGQAPVRTSALTAAEYASAKLDQNEERDFARLMAGEERLIVHDGGGVVKYSGTARLSTAPFASGQWLYVRVLNAYPVYALGGAYEVDRDLYRTGYNEIYNTPSNPPKFVATTGDPVENSTLNPNTPPPPTTPPTDGGTTTLTGLSLNKNSWTVGTPDPTFIISPLPSTASLPTCTSSNSILSFSTLFGRRIVTIDATAAAALTAAQTAVTITCGTQTATFTIKQPAGSTATVTAQEITEANGTTTLKLTITRPAAEVTAGATSSYWVGAMIPGGTLLSQDDEWFYLTAGATAGTFDWKQLVLPNPDTVAFARNIPVSATEVLTIPLGFKKVDFATFRIQIYAGYRLSGGTFKKLDYVWDSTRP